MTTIRPLILRFEKDVLITLAIFLLAVILRAPYFDYPPGHVFDEGFFVWYVTNTSYGTPFFELHPPLSWMIFSAVVPEVSEAGDPSQYLTLANTRQSFDFFPYEKLRLLNVFLGSLLPVIVYFIGRLLGFGVRFALLPASFVILDNALILYSRLMLPDTLLLLLGLSAVAAALAARRFIGLPAILSVVASGILAGLAASVKWTGFGFALSVALALIFIKRSKLAAVLFGLVVFITYTGVFFYYFDHMEMGPVDTSRGFFRGERIESLRFPGRAPVGEELQATFEYSRAIFETHKNPPPNLAAGMNRGSPLRWPLSMAPLRIWNSSYDGSFMILLGNPLTWSVAFIAMFVSIWFLVVNVMRRFRPFQDHQDHRHLIFLLFSYGFSFVPFLFVGRQLFMNTYLPALIFSYLLIPSVFKLLLPKISIVGLTDEKKEQVIFFVLLAGASLVSLSVSPMTYGF